jgi:hypothetical protein
VEDGLGDTGVGEVLVGASAKAMARAGVGANGLNGEVKEGGEVPWRVSVGNGCQDLLNKVGNGMYVGRGAAGKTDDHQSTGEILQAFQTLLNAGDPMLVETPVYAGVVSQCVMHKFDMIGGSCCGGFPFPGGGGS